VAVPADTIIPVVCSPPETPERSAAAKRITVESTLSNVDVPGSVAWPRETRTPVASMSEAIIFRVAEESTNPRESKIRELFAESALCVTLIFVALALRVPVPVCIVIDSRSMTIAAEVMMLEVLARAAVAHGIIVEVAVRVPVPVCIVIDSRSMTIAAVVMVLEVLVKVAAAHGITVESAVKVLETFESVALAVTIFVASALSVPVPVMVALASNQVKSEKAVQG
jgi:hypothetical protein